MSPFRRGSAGELLKVLNARVDDDTKRLKEWPDGANGLSGRLRLIAPALLTMGVEVRELRRRKGDRLKEWTIKIVQTVQTVQTQVSRDAGLNDVNDANDVSPNPSRRKVMI